MAVNGLDLFIVAKNYPDQLSSLFLQNKITDFLKW